MSSPPSRGGTSPGAAISDQHSAAAAAAAKQQQDPLFTTMEELLDIQTHIQPLPTSPPTLILGVTGSGKSSTVSLFIGENLAFGFPPDYKGERLAVMRAPFCLSPKTPGVPMAFPIGTGLASETTTPRIFPQDDEEMARYDYCGPLLVDCPGFFDTRSPIVDLRNTVLLDPLINHREGVHLVLVTSQTVATERGDAAGSALRLLSEKIGGSPADGGGGGGDITNQHISQQFSLIITKTPEDWIGEAYKNLFAKLATAAEGSILHTLQDIPKERVGFVYEFKVEKRDVKSGQGYTVLNTEELFENVKEAFDLAPLVKTQFVLQQQQQQQQQFKLQQQQQQQQKYSFALETQLWLSAQVNAFAEHLFQQLEQTMLTPLLTTIHTSLSQQQKNDPLDVQLSQHINIYQQQCSGVQQLLNTLCQEDILCGGVDVLNDIYNAAMQSSTIGQQSGGDGLNVNVDDNDDDNNNNIVSLKEMRLVCEDNNNDKNKNDNNNNNTWEKSCELLGAGFFFLKHCDELHQRVVISHQPNKYKKWCALRDELLSSYHQCVVAVYNYIVEQYKQHLTLDNALKQSQQHKQQPFAQTAQFFTTYTPNNIPNISTIMDYLISEGDISTATTKNNNNTTFHSTLVSLRPMLCSDSVDVDAVASTNGRGVAWLFNALRNHYLSYAQHLAQQFEEQKRVLQNFVEQQLFEPLLAACKMQVDIAKQQQPQHQQQQQQKSNFVLLWNNSAIMNVVKNQAIIERPTFAQLTDVVYPLVSALSGLLSSQSPQQQTSGNGGDSDEKMWVVMLNKTNALLTCMGPTQSPMYQMTKYKTQHTIDTIYKDILKHMGGEIVSLFDHVFSSVAQSHLQLNNNNDFLEMDPNKSNAQNQLDDNHILQHLTPWFQQQYYPFQSFVSVKSGGNDFAHLITLLEKEAKVKQYSKSDTTNITTLITTLRTVPTELHDKLGDVCFEKIAQHGQHLTQLLSAAFSKAMPTFVTTFFTTIGQNMSSFAQQHLQPGDVTPTTVQEMSKHAVLLIQHLEKFSTSTNFSPANVKWLSELSPDDQAPLFHNNNNNNNININNINNTFKDKQWDLGLDVLRAMTTANTPINMGFDISKAVLPIVNNFVNAVCGAYTQHIDQCAADAVKARCAFENTDSPNHPNHPMKLAEALRDFATTTNNAVRLGKMFDLKPFVDIIQQQSALSSSSSPLNAYRQAYESLHKTQHPMNLIIEFPTAIKTARDFQQQVDLLKECEGVKILNDTLFFSARSLAISKFNNIYQQSRSVGSYVVVGFDEVVWDEAVTLPGKNLFVVAPQVIITTSSGVAKANLSAPPPQQPQTSPGSGAHGAHGIDAGHFKLATKQVVVKKLTTTRSLAGPQHAKTLFDITMTGSNGTDGQSGRTGAAGANTKAPGDAAWCERFMSWDGVTVRWQSKDGYKVNANVDVGFLQGFGAAFGAKAHAGTCWVESTIGGTSPERGGPGGRGGQGGRGGEAIFFVGSTKTSYSGLDGRSGSGGATGADGAPSYQSGAKMEFHLSLYRWDLRNQTAYNGSALPYRSYSSQTVPYQSKPTISVPHPIHITIPDLSAIKDQFSALPQAATSGADGRTATTVLFR